MIIQISFSNERNEGLSVPRKTNLCTESAEWFSSPINELCKISETTMKNRMDSKIFKNKIEKNLKNLSFEKFKTSFFKESNDSIIFIILRKSGYSNKYYFRVKVNLKPLNSDFDKTEFIKHDIAEIMLSLDSENLEIFDLDNNMSDDKRNHEIENFFQINLKSWFRILFHKDKIIEQFENNNLFLLPYTKAKLGLN